MVWAPVVLILASEGAHHPREPIGVDGAVLLRLTVVAVGVLAFKRPVVQVVAWIAVGLGAWYGGALLAGACGTWPTVTAGALVTPSSRVAQSGVVVAMLRTEAVPRGNRRWAAPARILQWRPDGDADAWPVAGAGALVRGTGAGNPLGTVIVARGRLRGPRRASIPAGFDEATWLAGRGLRWVVDIDRKVPVVVADGRGLLAQLGHLVGTWRASLGRCFDEGLPPREAAIARSVLLGGGFDSTQRSPFVAVGLAHLFALSGLHVGLVVGLGLLILRPLPLGSTGRLMVMAPALVLYGTMVDLPGSVVRAISVVLAALVVRAAGRRLDALRLLGLVFWVTVAWRPAAVMDTGVQLSYLAAGGILVGLRMVQPWLAGLPGFARKLATALTVTAAAQQATLPVVARAFGVLPLLGPLINLVAVPVFGIAATCLVGGLVLRPVSVWLAEGLLACAATILRALNAGAVTVSAGGASATMGLGSWSTPRTLAHLALLGIAAYGLACGRRRGVVIASVVVVVTLVLPRFGRDAACDVEIHQFDVGQGDCALLRAGDGWSVLIDTGDVWRSGSGPLARAVVPFLRRWETNHLDAVVLTHGHADHTGGATALADATMVDGWYVGGRAASPDGTLHSRPAPGDTLHAWGPWALHVVHPAPEDRMLPGENNQSVVLALSRAGELRALWTGDLEVEGERRMLDRLPPVGPGGLDVLKAGHHGSRTSSSLAFLKRLRPRHVLISCGVENRHSHPSHGPYVTYGDTALIWRTDLNGTLRVFWDDRGVCRVIPQHPTPSLP